MSGLAFLLVAVGGAVGAVLRHVVDQVLSRVTPGDYPWGILLVNAVGSFVLGAVTPVLPRLPLLLVGVGFCGALTTYSTVAASTWGFVEQRRYARALVVITATLVVSLAAAALGLAVATTLS